MKNKKNKHKYIVRDDSMMITREKRTWGLVKFKGGQTYSDGR